MLSDLSTDNDAVAGLELVDAAENEHEADSGLESRNGEVWEADENEDQDQDQEHELEEELQDLKSHVSDWSHLLKQIKELLKNQSKILPLSQVNQLLILSNFATIHLKGVSRTQASLEIT
jgi:septal ring factor EnvC (AmiA/AmiB activator)